MAFFQYFYKMVLRFFKSFLLILLVVLCSPSIGFANADYDEKKIEVSMRMIGHQFLQKVGDSASRVLPITKNMQQYVIGFENEFVFKPDQLLETINEVIKETKIATAYIVEVKECNKLGVVYSYSIDSAHQLDMIPCGGRVYPKACYEFLLTLKEPGITYPLQQSTPHKIGTRPSSNKKWYWLCALALLLIGIFVFIKKNKTVDEPEPEDTEEPEESHLIQIGRYQFDKHSATLILADQRTTLSGKEASLLLLLHDNVNETIERDTILSKVWGDEGDYIGRTLDVFISKLRKKLEGDPDVKIVNIRGVGYKMIVS